jgi:hypothetical protein
LAAVLIVIRAGEKPRLWRGFLPDNYSIRNLGAALATACCIAENKAG